MASNISSIFRTKQPYHYKGEGDETFCKAIRETCQDFYNKSPIYKNICKEYNFYPEDIQTIEDISKIPTIPTAYLKRNNISIVHKSAIEVTSSGTGGQVSRIQYSFGEIILLAKMAIRMGILHKLFSHGNQFYEYLFILCIKNIFLSGFLQRVQE